MAICWLETWLNLPGKSPVLPVARMRCENGRAWEEQREKKVRIEPGLLYPNPGSTRLKTISEE